MENIPEAISTYVTLYGVKIIGSLLILIVGKSVARLLTRLVKRLMQKAHADEALISFLGSLTYALLLTFVIIAALSNLGVNTTSFIAVLGAAGLAVGLALQGSLSNFGAGVLLIIFKPFQVGDFVDAGGAMGTVETINVFNTTLKTPDNKAVIVPNSSIVGNNITNFSAKDTRRVDLTFGVSYNDDLRKVKEALADIVSSDTRVLKDPAPFVAVSELADSSVNFLVRSWVNSADYWNVYFDLIEKVKLRFDDKGITIPYPQQDVYLHKAEQEIKTA